MRLTHYYTPLGRSGFGNGETRSPDDITLGEIESYLDYLGYSVAPIVPAEEVVVPEPVAPVAPVVPPITPYYPPPVEPYYPPPVEPYYPPPVEPYYPPVTPTEPLPPVEEVKEEPKKVNTLMIALGILLVLSAASGTGETETATAIL